MYKYNDFDSAFVKTRNAQFRQQIARRIDGSLSEDEFKPLRLMNGVYLQLHAYMLRVAIPYGTLNSAQLRQLAYISQRWDRGYGHFTTRQNIQFNWPKLSDIPEMLEALAEVEMHALQTSGNTIRNVTADHFAAASADEIEDPRPYAELIRQWSTDHPEFQFMPRKFKIAVSGGARDRAVIKAHDIGLRLVKRGEDVGFEVSVGGGLGRTPMIGKTLNAFLPKSDLLAYLEAVVSVWNLLGRRDNKYKARIKITVHEHGIEDIKARVDQRFAEIKPTYQGIDQVFLDEIKAHFAPPHFTKLSTDAYETAYQLDPVFRSWVDTNTAPHKIEDHAIVTISLKKHGDTPGDASADQMRAIADLAQSLAYDEIRISHEQNAVLPHVPKSHLPEVYAVLKQQGLATANIGLISDIIACPGMDYCALATARSIPIAQEIATHFDHLKIEHEIGHLQVKISGCINACAHHHVAHIGILGLDRAGVENYQITLGGDATETAQIGERTGPGFSADAILPAIDRIVANYLDLRLSPAEIFLETYRRVGMAPFKAALYQDVSTTTKAA